MKRLSMNVKSYVVAAVLVATMASSVVSCSKEYDDSKIWQEIDKIKEELAQLRSDVMNEITAIKALIDGTLTVQDVVANEDGSTTVTLSDGTSFTVYPDRGEIPQNIVTVVEVDGVLYWATYNKQGKAELIVSNGKYIPVVSVTPQVRVNEDNNTIEVSFDGGTTWQTTGYTPSTSDSMIADVKVVYSEWQTDNNGNKIPLYCEITLADGNVLKVGMRGAKIILSIDTIFAPYGTERYFYITVDDPSDYMTEVPAGWDCKIKFRETNSAYEVVFTAPSYEDVVAGRAVAEGTFKMMVVFNDGSSAIARIHLTTEPVKVKFVDDIIRMEAGYGCDYMLYGMMSSYNNETLANNINKHLSGTTVNGVNEVSFFETTTAEVAIADIFKQKLQAGKEYYFWYVVPREDAETGSQYVLGEEIMVKIYKHSEVNFEVVESSFFDANISFEVEGSNGYVMGYSEAASFDPAERAFFFNENEYYFETNLLEDQSYQGSFISLFDKTYNATLLPGVEYTAWYVAKGDDDIYEAEDVKYWTFSTVDFEMGGNVELINSEPVIEYTSIEMELDSNDHITIYYKVVPYYEASAYPTDEHAIAMLRRDGKMNITTESVAVKYTGKDPGERVTLFAVAVDSDGKFGKVFKQDLKTKDIEYNGLSVALEMVSAKADDLRIKVSCDGAQKYMYIVCRTQDSEWKDIYGGTIKRAGNYMLINPNASTVRHSDDSRYALVNGEIKLEGLMIDDEYVIVVVAVDENGVSAGTGLYFNPMTNLGEFINETDANWAEGKPEVIVGPCFDGEFFNIEWYVAPQEGYTAYTAAIFLSMIEDEDLDTPEKIAAFLKTNGNKCEYSAEGYKHSWQEYADLDNDGTFGPDDYIEYSKDVPGVYNFYFYGTKKETMIYTTWCDSEGNFHAPIMVDPATSGTITQ